MTFILSACAERGYKLSTNDKVQTVTAQESIALSSSSTLEQNKLKRMTDAVNIKTSTLNTSSKTKSSSRHKVYTTSVENIVFQRTEETFVKFGKSEIHGHLIYINKHGVPESIKDTLIYLVPSNKKIDTWYKTFYLKDKTDYAHTTRIQYINKTSLNIHKNFIFYGVPTGDYYIIIASTKHTKEGKEEKIYIAKRLKVKKHKKIMVVFSKKL